MTEVIVVGGGVMGCATAFELAKRHVDVALVDQTLPGRATSASAGGLWPIGEAVGLGCGVILQAARGEFHDGPTILPAAFRRFLLQSNDLFPTLSEELVDKGGIDIEYEPGPGLIYAVLEESERDYVGRILDRLGGDGSVHWLPPTELREIEPLLNPKIVGGALIEGEHQVNPMMLAEGYKRAALECGARFLGSTLVECLLRRGDRVTGVRLRGGEHLLAETTINAAGAWSGELAASVDVFLPVEPIRGQIVLTETLPKTLNACVSTSACYLAQKKHGEVLIGSTTERVGFDTSVTREGISSLCRGAANVIPMLEKVWVKRVWAGLRPGSPDELPILGPVKGVDGYLNATGLFRTGIVAAPLAAKMLAQFLSGEELSFPMEPFLAERLPGTT